jgi:hypothetical protein
MTLPDPVLKELRLLRPEPFLVFSEGRQFLHNGPRRCRLGSTAIPSPCAGAGW